MLLDFDVLRTLGNIPRSDAARSINGLLVRLSDVRDRGSTLVIFVSHRWLRSRSGLPDSKSHAKYERVCVAVEILKRQFLAGTSNDQAEAPRRVLLWIDWSCLDQDEPELKARGVASLPAYVERSDVLLTPITGNRDTYGWGILARRWASRSDELLEMVTRTMYSLDRAMLLRHAHARELFSRGWIRMEEFLGSNTPLPKNGFGWFERKRVSHRRDRPHFFCTPELLPENFLLLLPRLVKSTLRALNPVGGEFHDERDRTAIATILGRVTWDDSDEHGYEGPRDDEGRPDGEGVETFADGSVFRGKFVAGCPAEGIIEYPTGDIYRGTVVTRGSRPAPHGTGEYQFADGDRYVGSFADGYASGVGTMYYSWGSVSRGTWASDSENGICTETFPDGSIYEGHFVNGQKHGPGAFTFRGSDRFVGRWNRRRVHGWGKFTTANEGQLSVYLRRGKPLWLPSFLRNPVIAVRAARWRRIVELSREFPG